MTLPGPSRTIIVEPIEQPEPAPAQPEREPDPAPSEPIPEPAEDPTPEPRTGEGACQERVLRDTPFFAGRIEGIRAWSLSDDLELRGRGIGSSEAWAADGAPTQAVCLDSNHRAPRSGCECGLYALHPQARISEWVESFMTDGRRRRGRGLGAHRAARGRVSRGVRPAESSLRAGWAPDQHEGAHRHPCRRSPIRGARGPAPAPGACGRVVSDQGDRPCVGGRRADPASGRPPSASTDLPRQPRPQVVEGGSVAGGRRFALMLTRRGVHARAATCPGSGSARCACADRRRSPRSRARSSIPVGDCNWYARPPGTTRAWRCARSPVGSASAPWPGRLAREIGPRLEAGRIAEVRSLTRSIGLRDRAKRTGFLTLLIAPDLPIEVEPEPEQTLRLDGCDWTECEPRVEP